MAAFCDAKDESGNPVVRVFVKGAAPAVIGRATSALAKGETDPLGRAAEPSGPTQEMAPPRQQGPADHGRRHEGHRPRDFDPDGDLLVPGPGPADDRAGRDDRPAPRRVAGRGPVRPGRQHPGPHGHRGRRGHRCGRRQAARHPRRGHPRHRAGGDVGGRAPGPDRRHRRGRPRGPRAQGADGRDPAQEGRGRRHDRATGSTTRRRSRPPTSASRWAPAPRSRRTPAA